MKESYYIHENTFILNFSQTYITTAHQLVESDGFTQFLKLYLRDLKQHHRSLYDFLTKDHTDEEAVVHDLKDVMNLLLMMNFDKIDVPYVKLPRVFLEIIENGYHFWRSMQRYSVLFANNPSGYQVKNFIDADSKVNSIALDFYRTIQEKVQGHNDNVYRQLQAGTNASVLFSQSNWPVPDAYQPLKNIPFVTLAMLRTPLLLHPKSNKRTNTFTEVPYNPIQDFVDRGEEWFCYPAMVGQVLVYAYFHRDHMTSLVSCSNLFSLARWQDIQGKKPDAILLFGNHDGTKDTTFYHDQKNDIWVGKVSESEEIDYFGYTKKAILTLHNLCMIQKGWLPIHGAMVNIYLKDGTKKGLMFMGDSGAGKSETLEALNYVGIEDIDHMDTVFDDMGTLHLDESGKIKGQGTEIGAFVRLDDLDQATAYRYLDRAILFNPERKNARIVVPAASYDLISDDHTVDCFLYANNYTDKRGMHFFENQDEAKKTFIEGKRFALGTTQEKGYSTTFFANPFGPMQKQEEYTVLIDHIFDELYKQQIPVGEIYTCLGLADKGEGGIEEAAKQLLDFVRQ